MRDPVTPPTRVGPVALGLGFAGLLPQVAAAGLTLFGPKAAALGYAIAAIYGALILSFLGGMWWSIAMWREQKQGSLVAIAITPSLVAGTILGWAGVLGDLSSPGPPVALGVAIMLTLFIDRHLIDTGEAPEGWMRLRVPLSLGLGALTIAVGLLAR